MKVYALSQYVELFKKNGLLVDCKVGGKSVTFITYNSLESVDNSLFFCKGAAFRSEYLVNAVERGAVCYVSEKIYPQVGCDYIIVSDIRLAMAVAAAMFYDNSFEKLKLTGITGTKGKSTTAYYIKYILDDYLAELGRGRSAICSSIDSFDGRTEEETHLTTPEAIELHRHFYNAAESDIDYFTMEVSSQALKYDRVYGVRFDTGVFLNISSDHISAVEHSDFEDYLAAKLRLFSLSRTAVVNLGTDLLPRVLEAAGASGQLITFGLSSDADVYGYNIEKVSGEIRFRVRTKSFDSDFSLTMPGLFNVENALAAIAVAEHYGIPLKFMQSGLRKARSKGRMECFTSPDGEISVIVDYAHNKLSFERLYQSVKEEFPGCRITTVFGCPGGKAYNRREELGRLAGLNSDSVYLTAEDPGPEQAGEISREIKKYIDCAACRCEIIDDRPQAINAAIAAAAPKTVVLITGKGSETRQKVGSEYLPYLSDTEYVKIALYGKINQ